MSYPEELHPTMSTPGKYTGPTTNDGEQQFEDKDRHAAPHKHGPSPVPEYSLEQRELGLELYRRVIDLWDACTSGKLGSLLEHYPYSCYWLESLLNARQF